MGGAGAGGTGAGGAGLADRRAALGLPPVAARPTWRERLPALADALGTSVGRLAAGVAVAAAVAAVLAWTLLAEPSRGDAAASLPRARPGAGPAAGVATTAVSDPAEAVVDAAGAVAHPGVYRVAAHARVADVVDAAGGPTPDADLDQVNLADPVADGERVYVPRRGERAPDAQGIGPPGGVGGFGSAHEPVNLNSATVDQLDALPGVGPATARAIVAWRTQHGRFRRVEDLLNVRGIGPAKLDQLRPEVRV